MDYICSSRVCALTALGRKSCRMVWRCSWERDSVLQPSVTGVQLVFPSISVPSLFTETVETEAEVYLSRRDVHVHPNSDSCSSAFLTPRVRRLRKECRRSCFRKTTYRDGKLGFTKVLPPDKAVAINISNERGGQWQLNFSRDAANGANQE